MLSQRVNAALVFIPLVLILIYLGGWAFNLFILLILLVATYEFTRLFKEMGHQPSLVMLLLGVALFVVQRWTLDDAYLVPLLTLLVLANTINGLVEYERGRDGAALGFVINLAGILYLGWVGGGMISLRALENGLGDSGAYFIGSWLGVKKMSPRLSPNKTWAGLAGEVVTGTLFGALLVLLWRSVGWLPAVTPLWQGAVMGFVLALVSAAGDLLVSLFKRTAKVKDTGNLIPGHGGILDRIDSWIWAALVGYHLVQLFAVI